LSWLPLFDWVNDAPEELEELAEVDATLRVGQEQIAREAATLGLRLPPAYKRLMSSSAIVESFPDYADSWFAYEEHFSPCTFGGRGRLLSVLHDQQNCVVWHLYLTPDGGEFVVSSWEARIESALWDKFNDGVPPDDEEQALTLEGATVCATSFDSFLYRLWREIRIYDKRGGTDDALLTDAERRYLDHYRTGQHLHAK